MYSYERSEADFVEKMRVANFGYSHFLVLLLSVTLIFEHDRCHIPHVYQ